jgi:hypothetical protein
MEPDINPHFQRPIRILATQFHADPTGSGSATLILAQVIDSISYLALKSRCVGSLDPVHPCLVPDRRETVHTETGQQTFFVTSEIPCLFK